ncbi:MAG: T9SS type A sorting domain-containing protein, partial [Bacteroidia bacterium]|nr:T9SS type A sorting domain-containing protein [Bacteroidia bacterium]
VEVRNFGSEEIVNPTVKYQLGNNTVVEEIYTGTIDPDSSVMHSFTETIDLSAVGSFNLKAWVDYAPDQNPANDLLEIPIEVIDGITISLGYEQNFDAWAKCVSAPVCELIICDLEEGWYNLANDVYDQHDWRTYSGPTPTSQTGPSADHTTGLFSGKYLYIEPSTYCLNKVAIINTPCVDLTNGVAPTLTLWYHAWGADIGQFHVDLFDGSEVIWDVVPAILGNQGDEWKELEIDLSPWNGQIVALRFRGITACNQKGDIAIDDIAIADITAAGPGQQGLTNRLRVYPNPASGEVTISLTGAGKQPYTLNIIDLFGRKVITKQLTSPDGNLQEQVSLSALPTSIYVVQLVSETEAYRAKLTIK